jgi:glucose/arabinose dehydrogenase
MRISHLRPRSAILGVLVFLALASSARAATVPSGFTEGLIASGLSSPTAMQFAPDGRLFVCEQGGRLRVIKNGALLSTPFVTLTVNSAGERGLLGVAFDPDFSTNSYVYVYYTATTPAIHNRISRFTANGDVAVPGSEVVIFDLDNLSSATNHNGGAIAFGPDGKLYAAVGENANSLHAQSMSNVHGKMLRLNKDGTIPTDNPFYASATGKNRAIWALGLRNPFTFAFHPQGTHLFINDVGETAWEEINDGIAGANYGWPWAEGYDNDPMYVSPRHAYSHSNGCAITGGTFYSPPSVQFPSDYVQDYFFADYCAGWIRKLDTAGNTVANFASGISSPVDLKVSTDGSLYYLARGSGATTGVVYRIQYGALPPSITQHPANQTVAPGAAVTFSVRASGSPPLQYQWQRDGVNISGATAQDYTINSVAQGDNGARFRARVSNTNGNVFSNEGVLTVSANQAPTGTITQPVSGTLYSGGMIVNYSGTGTDPQDGNLPGSAFTWQVDFHHDTHTHPFIAPTSGASGGSFTIPTTGHTEDNVWYRIYLTVRDSGGLTHTTQRDILPRKVRLTLATNPAGLQLRLDGQPVTTPHSFDSVVGIVRNLDAPTPQAPGGTTYNFASWSDGGTVNHDVATPATDTTYTATYQGNTSGVMPAGALAYYNFGAASGGIIPNQVQGTGALPRLDIRGSDYRVAGGEVIWNENLGSFTRSFPFNPNNGTFAETVTAFANIYGNGGTMALRLRVGAAAANLGQASSMGIITFRPNPDQNIHTVPPRSLELRRDGPSDPIYFLVREGANSIGHNNEFNDEVKSGPLTNLTADTTVIVVWDAQTLRIYVNNVLANTTQRVTANHPAPNYRIMAAVQPGLIHSADNQFYRGALQGLVVYNRVLNATEISELHNALNGTAPPPPQAPSNLRIVP